MQNVYDASCVSSRRTFEASAEKLSAYSPGQELGGNGGASECRAPGADLLLINAGEGTAAPPGSELESAGVLAAGPREDAAGEGARAGPMGGAARAGPGRSAA